MKTTLIVSLLSTVAFAAEPSAAEILARYDGIMGPGTYEAVSEMTATREDGTSRTYGMKFLKCDADKFRVWFSEPASLKGQEILRLGDNAWVYLPNLKRATRIANRDSFQGGDFNNADVLRVNYAADYTATLSPSTVPDSYAVELKSKTAETAYDRIRLVVRKSDLQPLKGEYFGTSGQMIRSATFSEHKEFEKGFTRPGRIVMQNEVVKARKTEMVTKSFKLNVEAPQQRFMQADLGK